MSATLPRSKSGSRQPKLAATSQEKKCKKQTQVGCGVWQCRSAARLQLSGTMLHVTCGPHRAPVTGSAPYLPLTLCALPRPAQMVGNPALQHKFSGKSQAELVRGDHVSCS